MFSNYVLIKLNFTVACLLAAAVLFAGFSESFAPEYAFGFELYFPFLLHLGLNALLLVIGSLKIKSVLNNGHARIGHLTELTVILPLLGLAIINFALAGRALYLMRPDTIWIALVLVPGLVSFWTFAVLFEEQRIDDAMLGGPAFVVIIGLRLMLACAGYVFWQILDGVLFDDKALTLTSLRALIKDISIEFGPHILALITVAAVFLAIAHLFGYLYRLYSKREHKDFNRALSDVELSYVDQSFRELQRYMDMREYPKSAQWIHHGSYIAFVPLMLLSMVPMYFYEDWGVHAYQRRDVLEPGWHFYVVKMGPSAVLYIFAFIFLYWSAFQLLLRLYPSFAEYVAANTNFPWTGDVTRQDEKLWNALVVAVRRRRLAPWRTFSAAKFLQSCSTGIERPVYLSTAAVVSATAFFFYHDYNDYDLFTENHIEYVDYWSLETHKLLYGDVQKVELGCYSSRGLNLDFTVVLRDSEKIDIIDSNQRTLKAQLSDYEKIDQKLRTAGVAYAFPQKSGVFNRGQSAFDRRCLEKIEDRYDERTASRIESLFHLDEFFAAEKKRTLTAERMHLQVQKKPIGTHRFRASRSASQIGLRLQMMSGASKAALLHINGECDLSLLFLIASAGDFGAASGASTESIYAARFRIDRKILVPLRDVLAAVDIDLVVQCEVFVPNFDLDVRPTRAHILLDFPVGADVVVLTNLVRCLGRSVNRHLGEEIGRGLVDFV